jgi:hypothetical protein
VKSPDVIATPGGFLLATGLRRASPSRGVCDPHPAQAIGILAYKGEHGGLTSSQGSATGGDPFEFEAIVTDARMEPKSTSAGQKERSSRSRDRGRIVEPLQRTSLTERPMAATDKCLALINKASDGRKATKPQRTFDRKVQGLLRTTTSRQPSGRDRQCPSVLALHGASYMKWSPPMPTSLKFIGVCAGTLAFFLFVINILQSSTPNAATATATTAPKEKSDDDKIFHVAYTCGTAVEKSAKYDLRWKLSSPSKRFPYTMGGRDMVNRITLVGDEAEAQNGFGGWVRVNYSCTFDWQSDKVVATTIEAGRLP